MLIILVTYDFIYSISSSEYRNESTATGLQSDVKLSKNDRNKPKGSFEASKWDLQRLGLVSHHNKDSSLYATIRKVLFLSDQILSPARIKLH